MQPSRETRFGFLSGRTRSIYHKRYWQDEQFEAIEHLKNFFAERNKALTQVAIAWVLAQPDVTSAIVGATSAEQIHQSLTATEITLDGDEIETCNDVWFRLPRLRDPSVAMR
jgi:aryl-alcohol dehydrogenase-like predicted oxidoreductase